MFFAEVPVSVGYPNTITYLESTAFVTGYDEERKNPAWGAYYVPAQKIPSNFPRPSSLSDLSLPCVQ